MTGSRLLSSMDDVIEVDCVHCDLCESYSRDALLRRHGDMDLPTLRFEIARAEGCSKVGNEGHLERCGIRYKGLIT